jgi:hypothetical protein
LTATVGGVALIATPTIRVTPGAVGATTSTVRVAVSSLVSGHAETVTIVLRDAAGNAIGGVTNAAFSFGLSGGASAGTFGTVTATAAKGTYTVRFTGTTAGTASALTATVNGVTLDAAPAIMVTPGAVNRTTSTVSFATATDASGSADTVTLVMKDAAGNAITGLPGSAFRFTRSGGTSKGTLGTVTETATAGTYTATFTGTTAGTSRTLIASVNGITLAARPTVTVIPRAVSATASTVRFATSTVASGNAVTLTIVVKDAAGNAIGGLDNSAFGFSLSGGTSDGTFGTVTETKTPGTYTVIFTGTTAGTASALTTTVDGVALTATPDILTV